jgi:nucleotide-binding universal stress UspA family protein
VHVLQADADLYDAYVADALAEHLSRTLVRLERYVRDALFTSCGHESWRCEVAFHVRLGEPARAIHQVAVDVDAEMILVGAEHAGRLRKLFHRSTAEQLVRTAHVPVVVAHQKNFRGLERSEEIEPHQITDDLIRSGLTSYGHVDFSESQRDSSLEVF